jgi:hypothetical protein
MLHALWYARCGCEVNGIILLLVLKGAMLLGRNKGKSVHVSTRTSFKAFQSINAKMSDRFLEQ